MSFALQHQCHLPKSVLSIDLSLGCSGFVAALVLGVNLLSRFENVVIVCADNYRSKVEKSDRSTSAIFSDAASACLIRREGALRIVGDSHFADGSGGKHLIQHLGGGIEPDRLQMAGADVLLFTQRVVPAEIQKLLKNSGVTKDEVDNWYFHQASKLVLDSLEARIAPKNSIRRNIEHIGNTTSSSIPILLASDLAALDGKVSVLSGFGVGLSVSSVLILSE
jgi:3-oxoacyl-[acyl-carrier-protein] synthase-3